MKSLNLNPNITTNSKNQKFFSKKYAKKEDLEKIQIAFLIGATRLSPLARRWLSFFVCSAKFGFSGIATSIAVLTANEFRVNHQTNSERTTYRALAELEQKGFIRRRTCRLGPDKFQTTIQFIPEAFAFYLQKKTSNVSPIRTETHIDLPLPSRQGDKFTRNNNILTPTIISNQHKSKKYAKKIASYLTHPVLYTILLLVSGRAARLCKTRFDREIETGDFVSGCDWTYWAERWTSCPIPWREETAKRELIPALLSPDYGKPKAGGGRIEQLVQSFLSQQDQETEQISPILATPPPSQTDWGAEREKILRELPREEREMMIEADKRLRERREMMKRERLTGS
jgi:hypothetical protein